MPFGILSRLSRFRKGASNYHFETRRRRCGSCLLLLALVALIFFYVRSTIDVAGAYNRQRLLFHSWLRPWRALPLEDKIFHGTKELPVPGSSVESEGESCDAGHPWSEYGEVEASESIVPCDIIDGIRYPICALRHPRNNKNFPNPPLGLFDATGAAQTECFDSKTRWDPYALSQSDGTANSTSSDKWDLLRIQESCLARNLHRLKAPFRASKASSDGILRKPRTAVVLRGYEGFRWTLDDLLNIRAMASELSLYSGGEYQIFILLHIHNVAGLEAFEDIRGHHVPPELVGVTETWTYGDCEAAYPKVGEYDVYFHTYMSLQLFAVRHPEFDYFWNWEMDVRYTGHYGRLFEGLSRWSASQSSEGLTDRNGRYYIQPYHGSYQDFAASTGTSRLTSLLDESTATNGHETRREADLITLFPIFEIAGTRWPWRNYLVNYNDSEASKPRLATVGTNIRLSRKLLMTMHGENVEGRAMMSEMWPSTAALHNGMKAVFAQHPVLTSRRWPPGRLQDVFNAGKDGQVGGSIATIINREDNFDGTTWYWNPKFPLDLYIRWLGKAKDGPGSPEWEAERGRLCLPGVLLHPVKSSKLPD